MRNDTWAKWAYSLFRRKTTYQALTSISTIAPVTWHHFSPLNPTWITETRLSYLGAGMLAAQAVAFWVIDWFDEDAKHLASQKAELERDRKLLAEKNGLEGVLHTVYHTVLLGTPSDTVAYGFRLCIHVRRDDVWEQATHFIGHCEKKGRGQTIDIGKGPVGECIRTGRNIDDKLRASDKMPDYFIKRYGYRIEDVAEMNLSSQSWVAYPVGKNGSISAVLYAECENPNFFGKSGSKRRSILEASVLGIAEALA